MKHVRLAGLLIAAAGVIGIAGWTAGVGHEPYAGRWTEASEAERKAAVRTMPAPAGTAARPLTREPADVPRSAGTKQRPPSPFVQRFADQRGVKAQGPKKKTGPVKVAATVDGCDRNYGTEAQCIPLVFPGKVADRCAWLRDHGFQEIKVAARDRQKLDADGNGVACDE
jgi:hypothetical protein